MTLSRSVLSTLCATACVIAMSAPAYAQQKQATNDDADWSGSIGVGVGVAPSYEGSGHYGAFPMPILTINWKDTVTFDRNGLNWYAFQSGALRGGIGATYDIGRDERDGSLPFSDRSDNRLIGMGDVDGSWGARLFASYDIKPVVIDGAVTQFFGSDNDGVLATVGLSAPHHFSEQLLITPGISTTWASDGYASPYFSVSAAQSAATGFSQFNASSGFKDVSAGVSATYFLDQSWYVTGDARVKQLVSDVADSPVTEEDTSGTFFTGVGYRF